MIREEGCSYGHAMRRRARVSLWSPRSRGKGGGGSHPPYTRLSPRWAGFQNAADGSVEKRHPLHACFSKLHPSLRIRPSSSSEKEMARWWEFAPWATQWEREAVVRKVMSGGGGMELHDICSAVRADGLLEALPHLPLPKTELMPALVQADANYEPAATLLPQTLIHPICAYPHKPSFLLPFSALCSISNLPYHSS